MSQPQQPLPTTTPPHQQSTQAKEQVTQIPAVQVQSFVSKVFTHVKKFQLKPFLQDIVTCLSIICAYQYVSITYQNQQLLQQFIGIEFGNKRTQAVILLIFAIYLITLNILHRLTYSYQTTPPTKPIPDNWQEMQQPSQLLQQPSNISGKNRQSLLTQDSYTLMIKELMSYSIYGFVFVLCATAYAYIGSFNKKHKIINLEQVNFLIFWAVTAVIFYSIGKIVGKLIGIKTLHHFGLVVVLIVLIVEIGVAHGFNMFIFL